MLLFVLMLGMKMWRWVIAEIHANNDSEESGDYGHDEFLSLIHLWELMRRMYTSLISHYYDISRARVARIS